MVASMSWPRVGGVFLAIEVEIRGGGGKEKLGMGHRRSGGITQEAVWREWEAASSKQNGAKDGNVRIGSEYSTEYYNRLTCLLSIDKLKRHQTKFQD